MIRSMIKEMRLKKKLEENSIISPAEFHLGRWVRTYKQNIYTKEKIFFLSIDQYKKYILNFNDWYWIPLEERT